MKRYTWGVVFITPMIRRTFRILPATGAMRERALWKEGVRDWDSFMGCDTVNGMSERRKEKCNAVIMAAQGRHSMGDCRGLASMLPRSELWRLYDDFKSKAAFLDIETDGLGPGCEVTVVGVHSRDGTQTFVSGEDLDVASVAQALEGTSVLITFNGSCFDIPVLTAAFPELQLDIPHIDLRFAARRAGLSGGLKVIERNLGLNRDEGIADVDGFEAVRLWNAWRRGCARSLDTLLEYNRADTENLPFVAEEVCSRLTKMTLGDMDGKVC